ncbi:predicted protein [Naegleria gruberi]|uniref:Predicted protein n=1 Tax=Naegleria gruberi TaxID=5762 RepID=D2V178_NAEGR|nr:uncharacterized protein NAEGRDRAFT_30183 [Naegleria gruberi]EFC49261.1 predicted protein [Naegleria gruberi]|eukprot:XP_002682005.1 predicted protein [Naegleria gruberi strain NEG-M]
MPPKHNNTHPVHPTHPIANHTHANTPVNDKSLIDRINSNHTHGWKATEYSRFDNMTISQLRDNLFGLSLMSSDEDTPRMANIETRVDIPMNFDARTQWKGCVPAIRDQQTCGACWAFSANYVLAHRLCIATNGQTNVVLSPEYQVQCDTMNKACQGGYLKYSWTFLENTGTPLDTCIPYASGGGTFSSGTCPTQCKIASMSMSKYKAKNTVYISGINNIKTAIMTYGSVQAGFTVYRDLTGYKSGVYKHLVSTVLGGHAVALIGFGVEGGSNYWLAANSWGPNWGMSGYFKIAQGEGGIENQVYAGEPVY